MTSSPHVTELLHAWQDGNEQALDQLFPLVYDEVHRLARAHRRRGNVPETLDTSALIHEAYLKLVDAQNVTVNDRAHFLALSSRAMRQVLINYVHHKRREKRGGGREAKTLLDHHYVGEIPMDQLLSINDALERLSNRNPRMGQIVECRFFGGLSVEETATALEISNRTVEREWTRAKLYLAALLEEDDLVTDRTH